MLTRHYLPVSSTMWKDVLSVYRVWQRCSSSTQQYLAPRDLSESHHIFPVYHSANTARILQNQTRSILKTVPGGQST